MTVLLGFKGLEGILVGLDHILPPQEISSKEEKCAYIFKQIKIVSVFCIGY